MLSIGLFSLFVLFGSGIGLFLYEPKDTTNVSNSEPQCTSRPCVDSVAKNMRTNKTDITVVNNDCSKLPSFCEKLKRDVNQFMEFKTESLKDVTDPNIKICRFNSGSDNGITASCLNAFIHLDIDNECDNPFFKKLMEKLRQEQKSVNDISTTINPHSIIHDIFNELGEDVVLQNIADNERNALKNCLLNGGNNPFEFMTALYKICGLEQNERFTRSVINKENGTKTVDSPCLRLTPPLSPEEILHGSNQFSAQQLFDIVKYQGFNRVVYVNQNDYWMREWKRKHSINFPTRCLCLSFDTLLPAVNLVMAKFYYNYHIGEFALSDSKDYILKALICCTLSKNEILEMKQHSILNINKKYSCILNNPSGKNSSTLVVIDPTSEKLVLNVNTGFMPIEAMIGALKIDDNNYRVPIMAFYEKK